MIVQFLKQYRKKYKKKDDHNIAYDPMTFFSDFDSGTPTAHLKRVSRNRIMFMAVFMSVLYGGLTYKAFMITMGTGHARDNNTIVPTYQRSEITDRTNTIIATQLKVSHLIVDSSKIIDPIEACDAITSVFPDIDQQRLKRILQDSKKRYSVIKRNLTPSEQQALHDFGLPGLFFETSDLRFYPQNELVSHIVGLAADTDKNGLSGIERQFDTVLKGGHQNSSGLALSVDLRVQEILRTELNNAIKTFDAVGGAAIVMNVKTGEILGMTSLPDFNPNHNVNINSSVMFNRATVGAYEMGSTFKIINSAIGLDTHAITMKDKFDVSRNIYVGRFSIGDFHRIYGSIDAAEIFKKSSNIGSVRIAEKFGPDIQKYYMKKLGLLDKTHIELPERASPIIPSIWGRIQMMTISFGHGLAVTPLQMVSATASLINGGTFVQPTLLKYNADDNMDKSAAQTPHYEIYKDNIGYLKSLWQSSDDKTTYFKQAKNHALPMNIAVHGDRVISPETSQKIRYIMRLVCETGGTGTNAEVIGYPVMGKTGTAEKQKTGQKGYNKKSLISSFIGAFPALNPEYVIYVMVDEPKPNLNISTFATGGVVAAPVVKKVIEQIAPILNVVPTMPTKDPHAISNQIYAVQ